MKNISLSDEENRFDVTVRESAHAVCLVLFAAGSGGSPERHLPLLTYLAENHCTVIAPHFERLSSPSPRAVDLILRARRLRLALDLFTPTEIPAVGVGHSIGATLLMALAGAQMWLRSGERLPISRDERLRRLVLFTPPTGFFQAPRALDQLEIPMQVWAGTLDTITPPDQAEFLKQNIQPPASLELRLVEGAGHFSFMNALPPQATDAMANREAFLATLADDVSRFILA